MLTKVTYTGSPSANFTWQRFLRVLSLYITDMIGWVLRDESSWGILLGEWRLVREVLWE